MDLRAGLRAALGFGLIAGGVEALQAGVAQHLFVGFFEALLAGLGMVLFGALVGLGAGLPASLPRGAGARAGVAAFSVAFFYLSFVTWKMVSAERWGAAAFMGAGPIAAGLFSAYNASYIQRRIDAGAEPPIGWLPFAGLVGLTGALIGAILGVGDRSPPVAAPDNGFRVLLITVDTLRRDHVSAYGEARARTPNIDALAAEGTRFDDAVSPTPETGPAHASMMTGLHPLRHGVRSNADELAAGFVTVADKARQEGWHTAAFVSSYAVATRSGLGQGFSTFDDDFSPFRGLADSRLAQLSLKGAMASGLPHLAPWLLERRGEDTVALAERWLAENGEREFFLWVHLFEPHAPYEGEGATVDHRGLLSDPAHAYTDSEKDELGRLYAAEVEVADGLVGRLVKAVEPWKEDTLVVVTADHGEMLGEHGVEFHHHGLWDEVVRVPLVMRIPRVAPAVVSSQVRLQDLAPTMLGWMNLGEMLNVEGIDLRGYAQGRRSVSLVADLFGREGPSLDRGCLFGTRLLSGIKGQEGGPEGRVKFIWSPETGDVALFDLVADPREERSIVDRQTAAVDGLKQMLRKAVESTPCAAEASLDEAAALRALGYLEDEKASK